MDKNDIPRGYVYHEMITEIAKETELSVGVIYILIADALETSVEEIRGELRAVESPYVCGSGNILGYINGKAQKRTTVKYKVDTMLIDIGKKLYGKETPPMEDLPIVLELLKRHLAEGFFEGAPQ